MLIHLDLPKFLFLILLQWTSYIKNNLSLRFNWKLPHFYLNWFSLDDPFWWTPIYIPNLFFTSLFTETNRLSLTNSLINGYLKCEPAEEWSTDTNMTVKFMGCHWPRYNKFCKTKTILDSCHGCILSIFFVSALVTI